MGRVKEIEIKVIPAKIANAFVKKYHYSGKVVFNSNLHFGCFLDNKLHGVMSFGPSMDKANMLGLVKNTGWNNFLELNRMAFDDYLPRNSESYSIGKAMRLIKKYAPQIKWVVSFADGISCGDGTIYRASNFLLTGIKKNVSFCQLPSGEKIHEISLKANPMQKRKELGGRTFFDVTGGTYNFKKYVKAAGGQIMDGYQFRYIYFIDKKAQKDLAVPVIPFSKIDELNAGMYKGEKVTQAERHAKKTVGQSDRTKKDGDA